MRRYIRCALQVYVSLVCALGAYPLLAHMDLSEEIAAISMRILANPDATQLYLQRGDLYRIDAHWREALADFDRAQQLEPNDVLAQLGMGRTWLDQGNYTLALEHLNRALARQPDNVRARIARAKAWRQAGEPLSAAADYEIAINTFVKPHDPLPDYYLERARALEAAGAGYVHVALAALDAGIIRLGNIRVLQDYAIELERKRGDYPAALVRLDRIIEQSMRKESLLLLRGDILRASGQTAEAAAAYAAALASIDALPARHRQSRTMLELRAALKSRNVSPVPSGTGG